VYFPVVTRLEGPIPSEEPQRPRRQRPRVSPQLWPEIAERAGCESLRDLALAYGVSHETIRMIVRRVHEDYLVRADA
jgi:hypothetical protein